MRIRTRFIRLCLDFGSAAIRCILRELLGWVDVVTEDAFFEKCNPPLIAIREGNVNHVVFRTLFNFGNCVGIHFFSLNASPA